MRFEARDLKKYAEPISESDLEEGAVYYALTFVDEEMLIPHVDTIVYVGVNLDGTDRDRVYFQDIDSFRDGIRFNTAAPEGAVFHSGSKDELQHIFDYEKLLDQLLACSIRREQTGVLRSRADR